MPTDKRNVESWAEAIPHFPIGSLVRSPDEPPYCLPSDKDAHLPLERLDAATPGDPSIMKPTSPDDREPSEVSTDRQIPYGWEQRPRVQTDLGFLYDMGTRAFTDALEATECVRVRLQWKAASLPESERRHLDRARRDCLDLRYDLKEILRQTEFAAEVAWRPGENDPQDYSGVAIYGPEFGWLWTTLHKVYSTKRGRRKVARHAKLLEWTGDEPKQIRQALTWRVSQTMWITRAEQLYTACTGNPFSSELSKPTGTD